MLETFAVTGGYPTASRMGNVMSVPLPTTTLIVPAAIPAKRDRDGLAGVHRGILGARGRARTGQDASPVTGHGRLHRRRVRAAGLEPATLAL